MPDLVTILMLAHNKAAYTRICLRGLLASSYPSLRFVLIDNGSTDETPDVLAAFARQPANRGWQAHIETLPRNVGAVSGRNRGLGLLDGRFAVWLDNDVTPRHRDWVERLASFLRDHPDVGIVQPKLIYPTPTPAPTHLIQCAGCDVSPRGKVNFRGRGEPRDHPAFSTVRDCQALISACWMLPTAVIRDLGPLDEQFNPIQFEDIDYCYRARERGLRAVYVPHVEMYHFENVTSGNTPRLNYNYVTLKNNAKFRRKWRHRFSQENGPDDSSMIWRDLPVVRLEDIGELEQVPAEAPAGEA